MTSSTLMSKWSSNIAIALSSLCVIHCLAIPIVILLAPTIGAFFTHTVEWWLTVGILPLAIIGFLPTWWKHKNRMRLFQFILAILLIIVAQTWLHVDHQVLHGSSANSLSMASLGKTGLSFIGAVILAWVTYQNNNHTHVCTNKNHRGHH